MVRIRLRRIGSKGRPFYRIVVTDQKEARNGKFIEIIGTYDPLSDPTESNISEDRARYWLSKGAQPSETVWRILKNHDIAEKAVKKG